MSPDRFLILLGHLPNLEDLSVRQRVGGSGEARVPAVLPKLSGRLTLLVHAEDFLPTLCKLPLRFRELCLQEHQYAYQQLLDACAETLVDFRTMIAAFSKL